MSPPNSPTPFAGYQHLAAFLLVCGFAAPAAAQNCPDNVTQELAALSGELADAPTIDSRSARLRIRELADTSALECDAALRTALSRMRLRSDQEGEGVVAEKQSLAKALREHADFEFRAGDVILLLRDAAPVSVAVSQIALQPGFFSHAAIVGTDEKQKKLSVIETVLDEGLRSVPLKEWTGTTFARFAVFRHRDAELALKAGLAAYQDAESRNAVGKEYDLAMRLNDPTLLYCSEVVTNAYRLAAPDALRVPSRLSSVGSLIETFPLTTLGVTDREVFLPDDLELDGRFESVIELRVPALIAKSAPLERVVRRLYDGLRGSDRERILAEIDKPAGGATKALASLFGGRYPMFSQIPKSAMPRLTGFGRLVSEELEREPKTTAP